TLEQIRFPLDVLLALRLRAAPHVKIRRCHAVDRELHQPHRARRVATGLLQTLPESRDPFQPALIRPGVSFFVSVESLEVMRPDLGFYDFRIRVCRSRRAVRRESLTWYVWCGVVGIAVFVLTHAISMRIGCVLHAQRIPNGCPFLISGS